MGEQAKANPEGDVAEMLRARAAYHAVRDRVVVALMPMADELADRARAGMIGGGRVPRDEVRSEAAVALLDAVDQFDGRGDLRRFAAQRVCWRIQDYGRKRTRHPEFSLHALLSSLDSRGEG